MWSLSYILHRFGSSLMDTISTNLFLSQCMIGYKIFMINSSSEWVGASYLPSISLPYLIWLFVDQLVHNLTFGCNIGYQGPQFPYTARNLQSAWNFEENQNSSISPGKGGSSGPVPTHQALWIAATVWERHDFSGRSQVLQVVLLSSRTK